MAIEWAGAYEKWAVNFVKKNAWRVCNILYSQEDCVQHCALVFSRCLAKYGAGVDAPHFMSLFQSAVFNEWTSLSLRNSRKLPLAEFALEDFDCVDAATPDNAHLSYMLRQAPKELLQVLEVLFSAPREVLEALTASSSGEEDALLCQLAGVPPFPVRRRLKKFLRGR